MLTDFHRIYQNQYNIPALPRAQTCYQSFSFFQKALSTETGLGGKLIG